MNESLCCISLISISSLPAALSWQNNALKCTQSKTLGQQFYPSSRLPVTPKIQNPTGTSWGKKPKTVQTTCKNHPTSCLQLIFFQPAMHQGSVRVSSQFPQVFAGVVLQEPIYRLPTTLLGSNTLTHSLFETNTIISLDLPMILDLSSYGADLQQCLFSTTCWNPSHICISLWVWPSWDGEEILTQAGTSSAEFGGLECCFICFLYKDLPPRWCVRMFCACWCSCCLNSSH